jgi:hypothetical protein
MFLVVGSAQVAVLLSLVYNFSRLDAEHTANLHREQSAYATVRRYFDQVLARDGGHE